MANNDFDYENDDDEFVERRAQHNRRASDIREITVTPDNFRLTAKEVAVVIGSIISVGSLMMTFNSQLEKTQAENTLKYELMSSKISALESSEGKNEKKLDDLKEQMDDIERTTAQIYQQMRKQ